MTTEAYEIHEGDIGTKFLVTIKEGGAALNISTCTIKKLIFRNPSGTVTEHDATFETSGSDGKIYWTTTADTDLDETGQWSLQAKITMTGTWKSSIVKFNVHPNLE